MHVRAEKNAVRSAGRNIHMRVNAALTDQFQLRQSFKQFSANGRSLPEQHKDFGLLQTL